MIHAIALFALVASLVGAALLFFYGIGTAALFMIFILGMLSIPVLFQIRMEMKQSHY